MKQFKTIDGCNGFLFTLDEKRGTYYGNDLSGYSLILNSSDDVFNLARKQGIKVVFADGEKYEYTADNPIVRKIASILDKLKS